MTKIGDKEGRWHSEIPGGTSKPHKNTPWGTCDKAGAPSFSYNN